MPTGLPSDGDIKEAKFARCFLLDQKGISKYVPAPTSYTYARRSAMHSLVERHGNLIAGSYDSSLSFGPWIDMEDTDDFKNSPVVNAELLYNMGVRINAGILPFLSLLLAQFDRLTLTLR